MRLTDSEEEMMIRGIAFSTSKPIPILVEDGCDGNYVCDAYLHSSKMELLIYEHPEGDVWKPICLSGEEVESVHIAAYIDDDDCRVCDSSNVQVITPTNTVNLEGLLSDRYEGLSLDTQAKRFFIDILKIYLR